MFDFPWSRLCLYLQIRVRTKFPNFFQWKIRLTFCNIHVLRHSFFVHSSNMGSHTCHHAQAEMQLRLLMEENEYGFPRLEARGKLSGFYCEQGQKCLSYLDDYFFICFPYHEKFGLSLLPGANSKYFHTIEILFLIYHLSTSLGFLFSFIWLGFTWCQWHYALSTEQSVYADIPEKLFPNRTLLPCRSALVT